MKNHSGLYLQFLGDEIYIFGIFPRDSNAFVTHGGPLNTNECMLMRQLRTVACHPRKTNNVIIGLGL